jgi:hypothetical protein
VINLNFIDTDGDARAVDENLSRILIAFESVCPVRLIVRINKK